MNITINVLNLHEDVADLVAELIITALESKDINVSSLHITVEAQI